MWSATFLVPAGNYEYKVALNDSWDVNYGANAIEENRDRWLAEWATIVR